MSDSQAALAALFPAVPLAAEADTFLAQSAKRSVFEQLRERRVLGILLVEFRSEKFPIHGSFGHGTSGCTISVNRDDAHEEQLITVAHEVGHTFEGDYLYCLDPPFPEYPRIIEDFCEEFARRWLTNSTVRKGLEELLVSVVDGAVDIKPRPWF